MRKVVCLIPWLGDTTTLRKGLQPGLAFAQIRFAGIDSPQWLLNQGIRCQSFRMLQACLCAIEGSRFVAIFLR